jgi:HK97 family phage major capsid protein
LNAPVDRSASEVRTDFKQAVAEVIAGARAALNPIEAANLPEELASSCSIGRLLREAGKGKNRSTCMTLPDGAEAEADREMRNRGQEFPGGLGIPEEGQLFPANMKIPTLNARAMEARRLQRDSLAQDFATAGALIAPQFQTPIELLRNKMALGRAGITVFSGVTGGSLVFPRLTAPTQSQSLAEGAVLASYDQTFDQVRMSPKRIGSTQNYSRLALAQANSNLEAIIWDDHMTANALRADCLGINGGGGADEPVGILNQVGIAAVAFGGSAANAYKNIIALETAIRSANIDEAPVYITTSKVRGTLRITPATLTGSTVVSGPSNALWVGDECAGRPAVDSQQVPNDVLIALVARHLMLASWAGLAVILDTLTLAKQDKYVLTVNQYIDWALRHPQAVARSADSLATLS